MQIVGIALVRNEDIYVERAIRNVAAFCDRIHVVDHMSTDHTWEILRKLALEYEQLEVRRARHTAASHRLLEGYAGSDTWVFRVDGDELYDRAGLARLRHELLGGAYGHVFRLAGNALNCFELDLERRLASGWLAPPSRPGVSLYNFAAIDSWTGCAQRLHGGTRAFRPGYRMESSDNLGERLSWEESPLRDLHVCFMRRSSRDPPAILASGRPNLSETQALRRGLLGALEHIARRTVGRGSGAERDESTWKAEKYRRGERVTVDASPFLPST